MWKKLRLGPYLCELMDVQAECCRRNDFGVVSYTRGESMKDFPMFTTSNGVASLVLKEIPYKQIAYITILDSADPEKLLDECVNFCVAVGAERVYATGHDYLNRYPKYATIVQMYCDTNNIPETDLSVFPMTELTTERFREIYNDRMKDVPMAAYMTKADVNDLLSKKSAYFVHKNSVLKGIGITNGISIEALASVEPGAGEDVLIALCSLFCENELYLTVAMENKRAVSLYRRCGFVMERPLKIWFQVH